MAVNFGIIGFGRMAELAHKPNIDKTPGAKLLAVCDITPARREAAKAAGIPRVYASLGELLKDPDIDAVSVVTPSHNHCKLALQVAKAGKHVLSEKPVSRSAAELKKTIAAIRKTGKLFTVYHNRRFDADFLAAKKIVHQKLVGDVVLFEGRWHLYGSAAGFGVKEYNQKWRETKRFGGGILLDLGVHMLDQLNQLAIGKPTQVFGSMFGGVWAKDCDDLASGMIKFDDGMTAIIEVSGLTKAKLPRYRITGTKGMAVLNAEKKCFDIYLGNTDTPNKTLSIDKPNMGSNVYRGFVAAIKDRRKKPAVTPESVVTTMQLIDAYVASDRTGKSVAITGPRVK
ncbi:MAG: Gfo/Idh/MocA family oxidoreductase [Planctomycetes bacterium]|nr:Gfo/Idh/MocA family oxidoreductase [Planctomycetota bacterium]